MCVTDPNGNAPNIASQALAAWDRHGAAIVRPMVGSAVVPQPSFTQPPDASGNAVSGAYRLLDAELQARPATAAPSMQQPAPSNRNVEVSSALAGKRSLPTGGPA